MTRKAATQAIVPPRRHSSDLLGVAYLGTIAIVMLAWIASLVWGAISFFSWLVS